MENKNIIIILVIVIVILAAAMAVMFMPSLNGQKDCEITIGDKTLNQGDNLTVELSDLNGNPIPDAWIDVTIKNSNGSVAFNDSLLTDSEGSVCVVANLDSGKYSVNASFSGNENFTANSTAQKLTIKEEVAQEPVTQQSTESSSSSDDELHYDAEVNVYYNSEGVIVDPDGEHPQGVGSSYESVRDARDRWERGEPVMV